jgi:hypothetical protein
MTYTIAECTVNKLLMIGREELSETCRVSCRSKFVKLVHLVGFIIKKIVGVFLWKFENSLSMQNGSAQTYHTPHTAHNLIY